MALKYYFDLMSQPCRAVYMLLHLNKVPFEPVSIAIRKGEHKTPDYLKINPFGLCPAIEHNGFCLTESIAMSKYIIREFDLADHWFPQDLKKQAKVEEYLHWQHFNTRFAAASLFRTLLIFPVATGVKPDPNEVEKLKKGVEKMVSKIESYYLKDTPYLSSNQISLADLFGACELMQLFAAHQEDLFEKSPRVNEWMQRIKEETNPHFDDAHKFTYNARQRYPEIMKKFQ